MKSIFMGKILKKSFWFGEDWRISGLPNPPKKINSKIEVIERPVILVTDITEPKLITGNEFYNIEDNQLYKIEKIVRGTDNSIVYFTNFIVEEIIDEESKIKAEKEMEEYRESKRKIAEAKREEMKKLLEETKIDLEVKAETEEKPQDPITIPKKSWWRKLYEMFI